MLIKYRSIHRKQRMIFRTFVQFIFLGNAVMCAAGHGHGHDDSHAAHAPHGSHDRSHVDHGSHEGHDHGGHDHGGHTHGSHELYHPPAKDRTDGITPLMSSILKNQINAARALIGDRETDLNAQNDKGIT